MIGFYKKIVFSVIVAIIISSLIFSCNKSDGPGKNDDIITQTNSEIAGKNNLVFGENRKTDSSVQDNGNNQKNFTEIEKGDIKGHLFPIISKTVIPDDMIIGPLLNYNRLNVIPGSFIDAVIIFFTDAGKGIINKEVLHPDWSEYIQKLYRSELSEKDYSVRIGEVFIKNGISSSNIRLIGKKGRTSGDVSADNFEGEILLSNISIDFIQLDNVYLREKSEFNPLNYSNILLNY